MTEAVVLKKCKDCAHVKDRHQAGRCLNYKCDCKEFVPMVDIEAYNSIDGKPPIELYKFQEDYLKDLPAKYIFAADTGTGKTFMALAHYDKHNYLMPLLILAPASKVRTGDWQRDIEQYFAGRLVPPYEIYSYEKFSRVPTVKQYQATGDRGIWRDYMSRHAGGYALICDEVHKVKNPQSRMGKAVFEVSQRARFFLGLSATPLPNGWIDAANYYKIFGFSRNLTEFKKRYCDIQTYIG